MPLSNFSIRLYPSIILIVSSILFLGIDANNQSAAAPQEALKILKNKCFDCHGDGADEGGLELDGLLEPAGLKKHERWHAVWQNVRAQTMPPADSESLTESEQKAILKWIEKDVFKLDAANPDPGRVTIRRLNREEYRNTIADLLRVNYDTTGEFPPDDSGYGFDTIGDVLSLSPILLEKYLKAAEEIVDQAIPPKPGIPSRNLNLSRFVHKSRRDINITSVPFSSEHRFVYAPRNRETAEYEIELEFQVTGAKSETANTAEFQLLFDGKSLVTRKLSQENSKKDTIKAKIRLEKNRSKYIEVQLKTTAPPKKGQPELKLEILSIVGTGPMVEIKRKKSAVFDEIFTEKTLPKDAKSLSAYRTKILKQWSSKIYRRPPSANSISKLEKLAREFESFAENDFVDGIAHAFKAMLISPHFLFRAEIQPEPDNPGKYVLIDEFALASRMSYFLWKSTPDSELLDLAKKGELRKSLKQQIDRMLKDEKSDRFVQSFVGQWLGARDVETISIDARRVLRKRGGSDEVSRQFNGQLRQAMRLETEQVFGYVLRESRPATELLSADYTFANEPLAKWYGIEGVKGNQVRKVDLPKGSARGGILTQSTFLIVTSNPTRTSPVKRGLFVLENLLATPAPPAVPDVPALEESAKGNNRRLPLRKVLELHRKADLCASCHNRMDPIGLALENFNAVGRWRDEEKGEKIDASGELLTGEKFTNAKELAEILISTRAEDFHRAIVEKLLTFAIGRGIEYYDVPEIDRIMERMRRRDGLLIEAVYGVIESAAFQKRRGDGDRF